MSWCSGFLCTSSNLKVYIFLTTTWCVVIAVHLSNLSLKRTLMTHEQHAHIMDLLRRENFSHVLLSSEWITYGGLLGRLLSLEAIKIFSKPLHLIYGHIAFSMSGSKQKPVEGFLLKHDETEIWLLWDPLFSFDAQWTETWDRKESFILLAVCCAGVYNNRDVTNVRLIKWF